MLPSTTASVDAGSTVDRRPTAHFGTRTARSQSSESRDAVDRPTGTGALPSSATVQPRLPPPDADADAHCLEAVAASGGLPPLRRLPPQPAADGLLRPPAWGKARLHDRGFVASLRRDDRRLDVPRGDASRSTTPSPQGEVGGITGGGGGSSKERPGRLKEPHGSRAAGMKRRAGPLFREISAHASASFLRPPSQDKTQTTWSGSAGNTRGGERRKCHGARRPSHERVGSVVPH